MDVMSVRIDPTTKKRMAEFKDVNWAEVIRRSLTERLDFEEELRTPVNRHRASRGAREIDRLRSKLASPGFDSSQEVRKWRDSRK